MGAVILVWGGLCATHDGEFWPFSIYPMFSSAGRPWTRVVVRDVSAEPRALDWHPVAPGDLPGRPLPLAAFDVFQNDLADFIARTSTWDHRQRDALHTMFDHPSLRARRLLVLKVHGSLVSGDSVRVVTTPWVLLGDTIAINPAAFGSGP